MVSEYGMLDQSSFGVGIALINNVRQSSGKQAE